MALSLPGASFSHPLCAAPSAAGHIPHLGPSPLIKSTSLAYGSHSLDAELEGTVNASWFPSLHSPGVPCFQVNAEAL